MIYIVPSIVSHQLVSKEELVARKRQIGRHNMARGMFKTLTLLFCSVSCIVIFYLTVAVIVEYFIFKDANRCEVGEYGLSRWPFVKPVMFYVNPQRLYPAGNNKCTGKLYAPPYKDYVWMCLNGGVKFDKFEDIPRVTHGEVAVIYEHSDIEVVLDGPLALCFLGDPLGTIQEPISMMRFSRANPTVSEGFVAVFSIDDSIRPDYAKLTAHQKLIANVELSISRLYNVPDMLWDSLESADPTYERPTKKKATTCPGWRFFR